jgi:hypothetical protein
MASIGTPYRHRRLVNEDGHKRERNVAQDDQLIWSTRPNESMMDARRMSNIDQRFPEPTRVMGQLWRATCAQAQWSSVRQESCDSLEPITYWSFRRQARDWAWSRSCCAGSEREATACATWVTLRLLSLA